MTRTRPLYLALLLCACAGGGGEAPPPADTAAASLPANTATPPPPAPPVPSPEIPLTEGQVVGILAIANEVDARAGQLAQRAGSDPRVRQFGGRLSSDHFGAGRAGAELASRIGVIAQPSALGDQLRQDGERSRSALERESGPEFDRVFLEGEVDYHHRILETIDSLLLPAAEQPELRRHLQQVRPVVDAHLQQARQLQRALPGGG